MFSVECVPSAILFFFSTQFWSVDVDGCGLRVTSGRTAVQVEYFPMVATDWLPCSNWWRPIWTTYDARYVIIGHRVALFRCAGVMIIAGAVGKRTALEYLSGTRWSFPCCVTRNILAYESWGKPTRYSSKAF